MNQYAVFKDPSVTSSLNANLKNAKIKGGIRCRLLDIPAEPESSAAIRNGEWSETASLNMTPNEGSEFNLSLDGSDAAVSALMSALRGNKSINEIIVYNVSAGTGKETYGYYFSRVFVKKAFSSVKFGHQKIMTLNCVCTSFKQKDDHNNEPVIWDWDTNSHKYTGSAK